MGLEGISEMTKGHLYKIQFVLENTTDFKQFTLNDTPS